MYVCIYERIIYEYKMWNYFYHASVKLLNIQSLDIVSHDLSQSSNMEAY